MRYDRLTGYFSAGALALAARGIEGLVGNDGHMRLVVGCTLEQPEIEAIDSGERLRDTVERRLSAAPLTPFDAVAAGALELISWMIARGHLSVKVAVPCTADRTPVPSDGIFHEKAGIIQDQGGHRIAWNGSLNETPSGWRHNWESINVLVLLTATPMQVHPVEVWDLLHLLGLPAEWTADAFLGFFDDLAQANPAPEGLDRMARLFRAVEGSYGAAIAADVARLTGLSRLKTNKVLRALRDEANTPRRRLETAERRAALAILRAHTPIRHLVSRHTRALLRRYFEAGMLTTPIAQRKVDDRFIELTEEERNLYAAVEAYIASTYNQAAAAERSAVGFVMTIYRRRLASSFRALCATLERHLEAIASGDRAHLSGLDEDAPDDETADEWLEAEEIAERERQALDAEERADIEHLLSRVRLLPPDSKCSHLVEVLARLRRDGYRQAMVFTQYADTMDFLRDELSNAGAMAADVLLGARWRGPVRGWFMAGDRQRRRQAPLPRPRG